MVPDEGGVYRQLRERGISDIPAVDRERLDIDELISRIEGQQAETRKFVAARSKLQAEALKLNRDRRLAPVLAVAAVIGGLLGVASFIAKVVWG
jgi:hypothetical protein